MSSPVTGNKIRKPSFFVFALLAHCSLLLCSYVIIGDHELVVKQVLAGKAQISLPVDFTVMAQEIVQKKYPQRAGRPLEVYTNADGSITVGVDHMDNKSTFEELPAYKKAFEAQFSKINGMELRRSEITKINDRDFIVIEMITPIPDGKVYNLMHITCFEGRLLLATFNCTEEHLKEWQPTGQRIMSSIQVQ